MLARRELSEAQVRQRLARKGHDPDTIDAAVTRLHDERALDDVRVANAIARTESGLKRHGKLRVERALQQAGIGAEETRRAIARVFGDLDPDELISAALTKRLRGRERIADDRELQRLYRYLIGQGFEADRVIKALAARRR